MKVKNLNELWLLNKTSSDVHLSDLGVKILAGKTVNVYKFNPHLTKKQVTESRKTGSLHKRLTTKTLVVIKKDPKGQQAIENLKASEESNIKAIKTKSSVVLGPESNIDEPDGDFTFADYGIIDMGDVARTKQDDGSIVVTPTQDEVEEQDSGVKLEPVIESGISKQSQIVMKTAQEAMTDPSGPHAKSSVPTQSQPFVVTKPPEPEEPEIETKTPTGLVIDKNEAGIITVGGEKKKPRSIQKVKRAKEGVAGDDSEGADEVIEFKKTEFDSKEPMKTNDGSIIMKLKEEEPVSEVKKAVVKKKRKTSKKKKKKKAKVNKKKDVK